MKKEIQEYVLNVYTSTGINLHDYKKLLRWILSGYIKRLVIYEI
jgi:hypothetical protein